MTRKLRSIAALLAITSAASVMAQRYSTEVFSHVKTTDNVWYGSNYTVITGGTVPLPVQNLLMTVYEPAGDTVGERPLVIYLHTGNFLPKGINKSTTGERQDSSVVEICKQFARRGYVAAAISYRLGWNPLSSDQDVRTSTLLNAVYRALQDTKTAVRYFRMNHATMGNEYGIDPSRIMVMSQGSGGYVSIAYPTLDKGAEIYLPKFYNFVTSTPYVDTTVIGNMDGYGGNSNWNIVNHAGYDHTVSMICNMGGAIGDSIWLENGDIPMVSFQCANDPYAPYGYGSVIVPTTGDFVVDASGSYEIQKIANQFGNNNILVNAGYNDVFTTKANTMNDGYEGLYPFYTSAPEAQSSPWDWWSTADPNHANSLTSNSDMSPQKGRLYIDTIMGYLVPRTITVMNLNTSTSAYVNPAEDQNSYTSLLSTGELKVESANISLMPNPATEYVLISSKTSATIQDLKVYDITGKIVYQSNPGESAVELSLNKWEAGVYFVSTTINGLSETNKFVVR